MSFIDHLTFVELLIGGLLLTFAIVAMIYAFHCRQRERRIRSYAVDLEEQNSELRNIIAHNIGEHDGWTIQALKQELDDEGPGPDEIIH